MKMIALAASVLVPAVALSAPVSLLCKTEVGTEVVVPDSQCVLTQASHIATMSFDIEQVNSSTLLEIKPCWGESNHWFGSVSTTPEMIVINTDFNDNQYDNQFTIDRKTLQAGWKLERGFQCEIVEVSTTSNKI